MTTPERMVSLRSLWGWVFSGLFLGLSLQNCNHARAQQQPQHLVLDAGSNTVQAFPTVDAGSVSPGNDAGTTQSPTTSTSNNANTEPDGNDDPVTDTGTGTLPSVAHFALVGRPPLGLRRICDLRVHNQSLYAAHANQPLGSDGATITRYNPDEPRPFSIAFDWNRPGEPNRFGGAGQGFLRVRRIGGRLYVADADPPNGGFGISESGTEGFVFISSPEGRFAPARQPHFRPPSPPTETVGGAGYLPRAYHVIDVIRYRGRLYASTGSVPPREPAWRGHSPGALHVANTAMNRWTFQVGYPYPYPNVNNVWRLTYMVRFHGRLYVGIQDYNWREPNDFVYYEPPANVTELSPSYAHTVRATPQGAAQTLRWYVDGNRLYWLSFGRDNVVRLQYTEDGDHWRAINFPQEGGVPTDITRFRGSLVVLTERALYRLNGDTPELVTNPILGPHPPFEMTDVMCAAPLAVYRNELYAGAQRGGALYRLTEGIPPQPEPQPVQQQRRRRRGGG